MWRVKDQIEQLVLAEIDPDGIKAYLDALEAVLENGGNEQKKYLLGSSGLSVRTENYWLLRR